MSLDAWIDLFNDGMEAINNVLWHDIALYVVLGVGILFTIWSGFSQWRALTHGVAVIRGKYDRKSDPGAISHFQALSAALSATVGIGNIGGVALAVALGGPGAVFWMWIVGLVGMALKTTEVTLSMLYRNTDKPDEPHGGPMWVADLGLRKMGPAWGRLGKLLAGIFCVTLLIATITGGNMFQAWNVAEVTANNFPALQSVTGGFVELLPAGAQPVAARLIHPQSLAGLILAILCGLVIIGGIKRIGAVAGQLVPFMCILYMLGALYVLAVHFLEIPSMMWLIVSSAFSPLEGQNAFLGGTAGYAFLWGMKRALFSNEAGQGSSPIAHSAARTDEPVREGVVAGLEPFIDTLVVCTLTSLVILSSGAWNRGAEGTLPETPTLVATDGNNWTVTTCPLPPRQAGYWKEGDTVFLIIRAQRSDQTADVRHRLNGTVTRENGHLCVAWQRHFCDSCVPTIEGPGIYSDYIGAALTSYAFDRVLPGLGRWMVTAAVWLFALSTVISWSYYGEQGMVYLLGERSVFTYRVIYCLFVVVTCLGFIRTDRELDNLSSLGTGIMLFANIPICLIFGQQTMRAYRDYIRKLRSGAFERKTAPATEG